MRKFTCLLVCLVAMLALAVPAYAQTATEDGYSGLAGQQQGGGGAEGGGGGGSLPFTGVELTLIAAVGLGLLGTGLVMRRASRFREGTP